MEEINENEAQFESRIDLSELSQAVAEVRAEIGKVLVGQHSVVDMLITGILADGHILLEGVPGVAKTLTAKLFAKVLKVDYSRVQFTPDLMPSDVLGTSVFNQKDGEFEFNYDDFGNLISLTDELDRIVSKACGAV